MKAPDVKIGTTEKVPRNIRLEPAILQMLHMVAIRENEEIGDLLAKLLLERLQAKYPALLADLARMLGQCPTSKAKGKRG